MASATARGMHPFVDDQTGATVVVGEVYAIVEEGDGWSHIHAQDGSDRGWVPSSYLERTSGGEGAASGLPAPLPDDGDGDGDDGAGPSLTPPPPPPEDGSFDDDDDDGDGRAAGQRLLGTALYDWEAKEADQISFAEGEVIEVLDQHESGWWWGRTLHNEEGCFPHNYVDIESAVGAAAASGGGAGEAAAAKKKGPDRPPPPKHHTRGPSMKIGTKAQPPASAKALGKPSGKPSTIAEEPSDGIIKQGMLFKKAMGKSKVGLHNWKMRFFTLTVNDLAYWDSWGGAASGAKLKGSVRVADITAVQQKKETAKAKANSFTVCVGGKELQIQAASQTEADEWMTAIRQAAGVSA